MKKRLTRAERNDVELVTGSDYFDEQYYLTTYPEVAQAEYGAAAHYVLRGGREGRDPSSRFSSTGYLDRYRDVKYSQWNPLVHFLRAGRGEGRLPNPLADDARLISESGMFDPDYYFEFVEDPEPGLDLVHHYLTTGAQEGRDPSEQFSTLTYLRTYPDIVGTGLNPLVHYLRHGRAEGRQIVRARPRPRAFQAVYGNRWPQLVPIPVVRVAGVGPRVTLLTDEMTSGSSDEGVDQSAVVLGMQLAERVGATLRLASRQRPPDPWAVHAAQRSSNVPFTRQVELVHLPADGVSPLLMGDREIVLACGWRVTRAALMGTVAPREIVSLVLDARETSVDSGDDEVLRWETLAPRDLLIVVRGRSLLSQVIADHPFLGTTAVSFEPAFSSEGSLDRETNQTGRRLLLHADPAVPSHLFWRSGEALYSALEQGVIDSRAWSIVCLRSGASELLLPRGVSLEMVERPADHTLSDDDLRTDAALVLRWGTSGPSLAAVALASRGVAVLTNGESQGSLPEISQNILTSTLDVDALVEGTSRLISLAEDDDRRRRNRDEDHIGRDWGAATKEALDVVQSRFETPGHDVR